MDRVFRNPVAITIVHNRFKPAAMLACMQFPHLACLRRHVYNMKNERMLCHFGIFIPERLRTHPDFKRFWDFYRKQRHAMGLYYIGERWPC